MISLNSRIYDVKTLFISENIVIIKVNKGRINFILGTMYISPLKDINLVLNSLKEHLFSIQQNFINTPFFLCGDFNSRIANENYLIDENLIFNENISTDRSSLDLTLNTRGKVLVDFMENAGFYVVNGRTTDDTPAQYTHVSALGSSVIDLVWVNEKGLELIDNLKVCMMSVHSDHFPVILTLKNFDNDEYLDSSITYVKWREDLLHDYLEVMECSSQIFLINSDVDSLNNNIENAITAAAKQIGMIKKLKNNSSKQRPW